MKRVVFLMIVFCGALFSLQAQQPTQTVHGVVTEKDTHEPLPGVHIVLTSDNRQFLTSTNEKGVFTLEQIPAGRCHIAASFIGFAPYVADNILVYSGKETVLEIVMEEKILGLEEVVIQAQVRKEQALNKMAVVSARMLSSEEANRYAGSWGDPSRMVANLAGVAAANDSRNDIVIRGNSPIGILWKMDGFEIPNPNHFGSMGGTGGPVGMLNNNQLANSDFYTGAFPAEFGNATSGVFDLRLRNGNNKQHEFLGSLGFNGAEIGAEGPLSRKTGASYMINGRYSFLSILDAMGFSIAGTGGGVPEYQDICAKINLPLRKGNLSFITLLGASQIESESDMDDNSDFEWKPGDEGNRMRMENKQVFTGLNYTHRFNTNTRLENRVSYQYFETDVVQRHVVFPTMEEKQHFNGVSSEGRISYMANLHHRVDPKNFITAGLGWDRYITKLDDMYKGEVLHHSNDPSDLIKGFVQWRYRINDAFSITPGVYSQLYTLNNDYSVEPRIGLKWNLNTHSSINLGSGLYSQLQPRQVYFYELNGVHKNNDLKMTKSWQSVLGYDLNFSKSLRLKTEIYYQHLYQVPVIPEIPEESILNLGDDFYNNWDYVFENKGTGRNYGIEVTLEKFFDRNYYFLLTGSLYDARYKGYDKVERHSKFAGNYALNLLVGYEWKIWEATLLSVNLKLAHMGGKRYIPATIEYEGAEWMYDYDQVYTKHLPDYFRCDLNINMKNNYKRFSVEWFVEITNITNHKNVWTQFYNSNHGKEEYVYQYGFMPIGGCRVYF